MTTTPTSGSEDLPEALHPIQRYEVVDCIDSKHVPAVIPKPQGPWVRYADHVAALTAQAITAQTDHSVDVNKMVAQAISAEPAGAAEPTYLCQAWGETDFPSVAIVRGLEAVRAFLVEQWLGGEDAEDWSGGKTLPRVMAEMKDEWDREGLEWKWSTEFEIGGISVQRVDDVGASHGQAPAQPTDAENLRKALKFYADGEHFIKSEPDAWDTVSGEPQNYWCDEAATATVEDGSIARLALAGHPVRFEDDATPTPQAADTVAAQGVPADVVDSLHDEIMRLPCKPNSMWYAGEQEAYRLGHRDARHAAAELAASQPAPPVDSRQAPVQVGGYPSLPDFDSGDEPVWNAIFLWKTATPGADASRKADAVTGAVIDQMRAYVDADRAARAPADSVLEDAERDHIRALIAQHADILEQNESAYFELAYHRATGWMAWITDKPLCMPPVINPDRKVLAQGQGDTADEACAAAARKQGANP